MPIKLNGATSGSVELDVPAAVGSDLQLTLPTVAGTLDRLERSGNILQAVQFARAGTSAASSSILSSSSFTFATFMDKEITTTQANSKILIMSNWVMYSGDRGRYRLLRGSTEIGYDPYARYSTATNDMDNYKISFLDSPSEPSGTAITYSIQGANANGSNDTLHFGYGDSGGGSDAVLILLEIAP